MPMNPTRYEYVPPIQVAGMAKDFTSKVEIAQSPQGWTATVHIVSSPLESAGVAAQRLRDEMQRLIEHLTGAAK